MSIIYNKEDHKLFIQQQTENICFALGIDYVEFSSDNYLDLRRQISSLFSGASLKRYTFDLNSIMFANQLFQELEENDS